MQQGIAVVPYNTATLVPIPRALGQPLPLKCPIQIRPHGPLVACVGFPSYQAGATKIAQLCTIMRAWGIKLSQSTSDNDVVIEIEQRCRLLQRTFVERALPRRLAAE